MAQVNSATLSSCLTLRSEAVEGFKRGHCCCHAACCLFCEVANQKTLQDTLYKPPPLRCAPVAAWRCANHTGVWVGSLGARLAATTAVSVIDCAAGSPACCQRC